jgi:hypothetical protein
MMYVRNVIRIVRIIYGIFMYILRIMIRTSYIMIIHINIIRKIYVCV